MLVEKQRIMLVEKKRQIWTQKKRGPIKYFSVINSQQKKYRNFQCYDSEWIAKSKKENKRWSVMT